MKTDYIDNNLMIPVSNKVKVVIDFKTDTILTIEDGVCIDAVMLPDDFKLFLFEKYLMEANNLEKQ